MPGSNSLLKNLHHRLHAGTHPDSDPAHTPLLEHSAILDLLYRVQELNAPAEYSRDVEHRMLGDARSVYRGYGLDYEESRPYQPGDELRFMNWRLMARTGEAYMKVFREERRPGIFIVVDRRAPMRFGTRVRLKVTQAARVAAVAAFGAQQRNAPVGGVMLEAEPRWIAESGGEQAAFNLINAAVAPCPPVDSVPDEPSLAHMVRVLQAMLPRGTGVYLVSDFHDIGEADRPALLQLATEHRICAIQIIDPAERRLPSAGPLRIAAPASAASQTIDTSDPAIGAAFEAAATHRAEAIRQLFAGMDIAHVSVMADREDIEREIPYL